MEAVYRERLSVVRVKCRGGTTRRASERREETTTTTTTTTVPASTWFFSLTGSPALLARSKLRAGSQKLPVLVESARSWIILPKGIFIGRECMQKRGHRHKGAAPADLALTQLREWTHGFKTRAEGRRYPEPSVYRVRPDSPRRNGLPNFPSCASAASFLPRSFACGSFSPLPLPSYLIVLDKTAYANSLY